MGEQHANGWRVSRHRLVADVTVGVIANPMSGRDIRRLIASASVFPNAEKAKVRRRQVEANLLHAPLKPVAQVESTGQPAGCVRRDTLDRFGSLAISRGEALSRVPTGPAGD